MYIQRALIGEGCFVPIFRIVFFVQFKFVYLFFLNDTRNLTSLAVDFDLLYVSELSMKIERTFVTYQSLKRIQKDNHTLSCFLPINVPIFDRQNFGD